MTVMVLEKRNDLIGKRGPKDESRDCVKLVLIAGDWQL